MKIIKTFKNNELLTFTDNNKIKIYIDKNYNKCNIKKGYKMNLINSNKGSYKGSFMNNYICKKFISNQKLNITNIETNKILNYCKYFLLSINEYYNLKLYNNKYQHFWFLRSLFSSHTDYFTHIYINGAADYWTANLSGGFVPFFYKKED